MRWLPAVLGLVAAAVCLRLGVWQLDRRAERLAWNAGVERRMASPAITVMSGIPEVPAESLAFRRARAEGRFAFEDQVVVRNRTHRGVPGVHVLTPLRFPDGTAVLVNRGWTYAPDAATADLDAVAEPTEAAVEGVFEPPDRRAVVPDSLPVEYPLFPLVLRRLSPAPGGPEALLPAVLPALDAGPHLSYAVQWFVFATIAAVGGVILSVRPGRPGRLPPN